MPSRSRWPRAEPLLLAVLLWLGCAGAARAQALAPIERLVLAATLDGAATAEPLIVRREGARLWIAAADLRALGVAVKGVGEVELGHVPGLEARIDAATQTLALTRTSQADTRPGMAPVTPNGWGLLINYDLSATRGPRRLTAGGLIDAVLYGPRGYAFATAVATSDTGVRRLEAGYVLADPGAARRLTLGDTVTGASERSRPVRLAGVQLQSDFDLRPDLVTLPTPVLRGQASVPSAVDLIVNGQRQAGRQVEAGQFAVRDAPVQTGVNTLTVAVRDALGRETRQTVTTYASRALLRRGLTAYSVEAGLVRTGFATTDDRYREAAAAGSVRRGLTDRLTAEAHGELSGRVATGTLGASLGLGAGGLLSASLGASRNGGTELGLGYERIARPVSIAARWTRTSGGWRDLAADHGAAVRRTTAVLNLGFDLGRLGTLGVAAIDLGRARMQRSGATPTRSRLTTATYSVRLGQRVNLVANGGIDWQRRRSGFVSVGALMTWGSRRSGYAGALARSGGASANAEWTQAAVAPGDWGGRLAAGAGDIERVSGEVSHLGRIGLWSAGVEHVEGSLAARVGARGALVVGGGGGGVTAADRIDGSFAVVDAGRPGVPVLRDGRRVGVTGRDGTLLIPQLPAFAATRIALDPLALDADVAVDATERVVRPGLRVGVPIRFALRPAHMLTARLTGPDGRALPAGARAEVNGDAPQPVGLDGAVWIERALPANVVRVTLADGRRCTARFPAGSAREVVATCLADQVVATRE